MAADKLLLPKHQSLPAANCRVYLGSRHIFGLWAAVILYLIWTWSSALDVFLPISPASYFARFQQCSIDNYLVTGLPFLNNVLPLTLPEFQHRRNRLAEALHQDQLDAFIAEPGSSFQYYANTSQVEWEPWEPEERPFLMIVQPVRGKYGAISAKTLFLAPAFEAERVKLLGMPFATELEILTWEEHWDPYKTLQESESFKHIKKPRVMVDEEMRDFIQRGLATTGFEVVGLGGEVERVKQTKSAAEIAILRAVNTGTVEAIRAMRKCMYPGLTEQQVTTVLDNTLRAAALQPFFDLVLFEENASNPHGGTNGSKLLGVEDFVLIDVGAKLFGYSSDVTRTFFPPFLLETPEIREKLSDKIHVWDVVFEAQTVSIDQFKSNHTAASVDVAARELITTAGYGKAFTHRVGHGIGIKGHESPYLNKGNTMDLLREGMVFTTEPGVYLRDKFGVRHEDVFLVKGEGEAECLSCPRAAGPWEP